jgi:hypothetical protein
MSRKDCFIADQRGAVAFEMVIVYVFLISCLVMPLTDLAIAGFRFISAWEALRAFGQSIQYSPPPDVTNPDASPTLWATTMRAKADSRYPIPSIQVLCGDSQLACSATNLGPPQYYSYTTSVTLAPLVLTSVLCRSGNANPCTFTLPYSERFE